MRFSVSTYDLIHDLILIRVTFYKWVSISFKSHFQ